MKIGNRVFVGVGAIILPVVIIGNDVVIGTGSVVTLDIFDGQIVAGNPARILGPMDEFLRRKREEIKNYPCFGEEYTLRKNPNADMKNVMNTKMKDRIGYIV